MLIYIIPIFLILVALFTNYSLVWDTAKKKGYEGVTKIKLASLVPFWGNKYVDRLENLKPMVSTAEFEYIYSFSYIIKRVGLVSLIVLGFFLLMIPISILGYLSLVNNVMATSLTIFLIVVILLLHQGLVVEYAYKKGYEGIEPGLIGLVPVYGFIHFKLRPKRRNISSQALKATFSLGNIVKKILVYSELSLLVVIVLIPIMYIFGMAFSESLSSVPNTIWPENPSLNGFIYLFTSSESNFGTWYLNTFLIALVNMIVGTVIITGASYVFARFSFK